MAEQSDKMRRSRTSGGETETAARTEPSFIAKRSLVPLNEYAAAHGLSEELIEQQGRLGVVQIRKFQGQKFVVDIPDDAAFGDEDEKPVDSGAGAARQSKNRAILSSPAIFIIVALGAILAAVIWLYLDRQIAFEQLNQQFSALQGQYETNQEVKTAQNELSASRAELQTVRQQITASRSDFDKIQTDLAKARRTLETIQNDLTGVQGQLSASRAEIEGIQNDLNANKQKIDTAAGDTRERR